MTTPEGVMKRLTYCHDLRDMLRVINKTSRYDKLIHLKRNKLEALVMGYSLRENEDFLVSASTAYNYVDNEITKIYALQGLDRVQAAKDLLSLLHVVDGQKQDAMLQSIGENTRLNNLKNKLNRLVEGIDPGPLLNEIKSRSGLTTDFINKQISEFLEIESRFKHHEQTQGDYNRKIEDENAQACKLIAEKYNALKEELNQKIDAAKAINDTDTLNVLNLKYEELAKARSREISAAEDEHIAKISAYVDQWNMLLDERHEKCRSIALEIRNRLYENSGVSAEDAEKWYRSISYHQSARKAFIKSKGIEALFKARAMEIYRLTGGRIPAFELYVDDAEIDDGRAFSRSNLETLKKNEVHLSSTRIVTHPSVIYHELTHLIEYQNLFLSSMAKEYVQSRSEDGVVHQLSDLIPGRMYRNDEKAFKTTMFSHYAAKVYDASASELYTMVLEKLISDDELVANYAKDSDTFNFALGAILTPKTDCQNLAVNLVSIANDNDLSGMDFQYVSGLLKKIVGSFEVHTGGIDLVHEGELDNVRSLISEGNENTVTSKSGRKYVICRSRNAKTKHDSRGRAGYYVFDISANYSLTKMVRKKIMIDGNHAFAVQIDNPTVAVIVIALYEFFYKCSAESINEMKINNFMLDDSVFMTNHIIATAENMGFK